LRKKLADIEKRLSTKRERVTEAEARRRRAVAVAGLKELEFRKRRGELIDRQEVERAASDRGRIEREAWQNWPNRIVPIMAAEIGVDARVLQVAMDKYIRQHLEERSEYMPLLAEGSS